MVAVIVQIVRMVFGVVTLWSLYLEMNVAEELTVLVFSNDVTLNLFLYNVGIGLEYVHCHNPQSQKVWMWI
jgi:hypothetical protein